MSFKQKLRDGNILIGMLITLDNQVIVEALSNTGLDWLFIDMEHAPLSIGDVQRLIQSTSKSCSTLIRIQDNNPVYIKQALDIGCDGIIVPQINDAENALRVVEACKYPPIGTRSVGISRAHKYGSNFKNYIENANENIAIIIQIEHIKAVENIDSILNVNGIDGIFIGPYDLSGSMGLTGQIQHQEVQNAIRIVKTAAAARSIPIGIFTGDIESARSQLTDKIQFVAVGIDIMHLVGVTGNIVRSLKDI
jgi:2-dehydro-3-deoxyglucarate aldolase/4-hydroxy-2-oxoheptanedioate aldolase